MPLTSAPVARSLGGLSEGSGRTLVIAGPPLSGKSELLAQLRGELASRPVRVVDLRGTYRDRATPYATFAAAATPLPPEVGEPEPEGELPEEPELPPEVESELPASPFAFAPVDDAPRSRRRPERSRSVFFGPSRPRGEAMIDPREYYGELVEGFRADPGKATAILVEDATLVDPESRDVLLYVSERTRWRPLLVVLVLDTSLPAFSAWEERLLGRGDVDWVRISQANPDPREAHRLGETFAAIPDATGRVLVFAALMGGSVSEVSLGRATRLNFRALAETLAPAVEANLVRLAEGRVTIPHLAWVALIPDLVPDAVRKEMERDIGDALAALNPEPDLKRRIEMANHYYAAAPDPTAFRYLLETAEISERLAAFDASEVAVARALTCLPSLPPSDRPEAEAELELFHARTLVFTGRLEEAERALEEGISTALNENVPPDRLEEWVELLLPALRAAGPRPSLVMELTELADRCHDSGAIAAEVLLQIALSEFAFDRDHGERARVEAERALKMARTLGPGPVQGLALLSMGTILAEGTAAERALGQRFFASARSMLAASRRYGLEQIAEELRLRSWSTAATRRRRSRGTSAPSRSRNGSAPGWSSCTTTSTWRRSCSTDPTPATRRRAVPCPGLASSRRPFTSCRRRRRISASGSSRVDSRRPTNGSTSPATDGLPCSTDPDLCSTRSSGPRRRSGSPFSSSPTTDRRRRRRTSSGSTAARGRWRRPRDG